MILRLGRAVLSDGWVVLHLLVTAIPAVYCVVLALSGDTFSQAGPAFEPMARVASEGQWSGASGMVALFGFVALWVPSRSFWALTTILLAAWHGVVAWKIFEASPQIPGTYIYAMFAFIATIKAGMRRDFDGWHF